LVPNPARRLAGLAKLAVVTTVTSLILVGLGGLVRGTDNGLACPDWPRCYGKWIPRQADLPEGLTLWNAWIEHGHRSVAGLLLVLVVAVAVWALVGYRHRPRVWLPALGAVVGVFGQAALGAAVVLLKLRAELVTAHLGLAMLIVAGLVALTVELASPAGRVTQRSAADLRRARTSAWVALLALAQILVGGHVTGIGAGLAYRGFPWLSPGVAGAGTEQKFFHVSHRLLALALMLAVGYLLMVAARHRELDHGPWLLRLPALACGLVVVQIALGAANLFNGSQAWTVVPHLAVASWIWTLLVTDAALAYRLGAPSPVPDPSAAAAAVQRVAA
jgi:heme A synthase